MWYRSFEAGAAVNHANEIDKNALIQAVITDQSTTGVLLLNAGASTELRDKSMNTALDLARSYSAGSIIIDMLEEAEEKVRRDQVETAPFQGRHG